ncbi:hypothetical protein ACTGJ9_025815 [Bradyrhizobium sp. RDM12]
MDAPAVASEDSAVRGERRAGHAQCVALHRPSLFQLRLHFVLEERIGVEQISATQDLDAEFFRGRALELPELVPEPDHFALFLDCHESPPKAVTH